MKRPVLVTIVGVIMILVGVFQGFIGFVTFLDRHDAKFLHDANMTSSQATAFAVFLMAFGVVSVLLGGALLGGSKIARMLVGVFEVLQAAGAIWVLIAGSSSQRASAVGALVGSVIVLYFLFGTTKAKEFFA